MCHGPDLLGYDAVQLGRIVPTLMNLFALWCWKAQTIVAGDSPKRLRLLTKLHNVCWNDCSLGKITVWYHDGF